MSLGIKTQSGIQRIHSVRVKPTTAAKTITANGTYTAADDNVGGYSSVNVNVYNFFDSTVTAGTIDNKFLNSSGEQVGDSDYYISQPLPVQVGKKYKWFFGWSSGHTSPTVCFYNANDEYISGATHGSSEQDFDFTVPAGTAYLRASVYKVDKATAMLCATP